MVSPFIDNKYILVPAKIGSSLLGGRRSRKLAVNAILYQQYY